MKRNFGSNVSHGNLHCAPVQREEIGRLLVGDPFEGDAQFPLLPPDLQRIVFQKSMQRSKISFLTIKYFIHIQMDVRN